MDNLTCHKANAVATLFEGCRASIFWLTKYSPDFFTIEKAFSKLKQFLKRMKAQTLDNRIEPIAHDQQLNTETAAYG